MMERRKNIPSKTPSAPDRAANDRRSFLGRFKSAVGRAAIAGGALVGFAALRSGRVPGSDGRNGLGLVRPPGARDEKEFLALCIRCTRCSDSCEAQCLLLLGPEAGDLQGTPHMIPADRACSLCMKCCETCPTGAILPLENKEDARIGVAVVDKRLCVSHAGTGVCGACHTICPLRNRAITQDFRNAPVIHDDRCVGCGLCEEICIVRDRRAIRVKTDRHWPEAPRGVQVS